MTAIAIIFISILYLMIVSMLFTYGLNFFYLSYQAAKQNKRGSEEISEVDEWPRVTVQLPVYNERHVAERLIRSAAQMDYSNEKLEIQVLDDSTDETVQIIAQVVDQLKAKGLDIKHVHRKKREGYKAGALKNGFESATGEFMALFDADFVPSRNFLKKTIPHFGNTEVGFVQARWGHINSENSLLTHIQSLSIDAHFVVEQFARFTGGYWFNFNGTAGVWRRQAIEDAGGWTADTLTEDLDLSYRMQLKGWKANFLRDVVVPAELPVTMNGYRRQQHRWARGSLECAIKLLPRVWESKAPLRIKAQSTLHLTGYLVHVLMFSLNLLYPIVVLLSQQYPQLISLFGITILFNLTAFAPSVFFLTAQSQLGRKWLPLVPSIALVSIAGMGMMINTVRAALQTVQKKAFPFERTPKFGATEGGNDWVKSNYKLKMDPIIFYELIFAVFNLGIVGMGIYFGNIFITVFAAIYSTGLFFTSGYTIAQSLHVRQKQLAQKLALEEQK
ncbi:MAG: glycosyltransferase [Chloroflexi bacterium]|nr:glycosyltransferase [Chloroflexota bacterium]